MRAPSKSCSPPTRTLGAVLAALLAGATLLSSQAAPPEPDYTVLTPESLAGLEHGKLAGTEGTVAGEAVRYSVQDLDLMQPAAVTLVAGDPAVPVRLEIVKGEWDKVFRSCDTGASGPCEVRFRTQGNFGIKVSSPAGPSTTYQLAVWVGDEVQTVPINLLEEPTEKGLNPMLAALGGLLLAALVAGLIGFVLRRRRAAARSVSMLGLTVALMAWCSSPPLLLAQPVKNIASGLLDWGKKVGEEAYKQQYNLQDLMKDFEPLSPEDAAQNPQYPLPPGGGMPSRCSGAGKKACDECGFDVALADLQSTRYRLEKLRRVYASSKNMISHSLAVGDSLAGAAGVGGLAWVSERTKILESFKGVQSAYDAKYAELMALLQESLQGISRCEETVFGEEDWYARFGFMYYEFMAARYQRAD